jgi:muramoyltetrapeptide carboxypeptidase
VIYAVNSTQTPDRGHHRSDLPFGPIADSPSKDPQKELERGIDYLKELGFEVLIGKRALDEGYFGAGKPVERADDINPMFADPQVHAIISTHGGVYANATLPDQDYTAIQANSKILLGFSEISTLHLAIYAATGLVIFHGNMVTYYFGMEPQEYDRQEFLGRLMEGKIGPLEKQSPWLTARGAAL